MPRHISPITQCPAREFHTLETYFRTMTVRRWFILTVPYPRPYFLPSVRRLRLKISCICFLSTSHFHFSVYKIYISNVIVELNLEFSFFFSASIINQLNYQINGPVELSNDAVVSCLVEILFSTNLYALMRQNITSFALEWTCQARTVLLFHLQKLILVVHILTISVLQLLVFR